MKRSINEPRVDFVQSQIDPRNRKCFSSRVLVSQAAANLNIDDLVFIKTLLSKEILVKKNALFAQIPNDIWKIIFRLLAYETDISKVSIVKQVCRRWIFLFPEAINEATISRKQSSDGIWELRNLQTLKIKTNVEIPLKFFENRFPKLEKLVLTVSTVACNPKVTSEMWCQLTNLKCLDFSRIFETSAFPSIIDNQNLPLLTSLQTLKFGLGCERFTLSSLKSLVHLKELNIRYDDFTNISQFEKIYGKDLQLLESLKELQIVKLQMKGYLKSHVIQEKFPHVRFQWYIKASNTIDYYEGTFDENFFLKGKLYYNNGERYEGTFVNNKKSGYGTMYYSNGDIYEGQFKKEDEEGNGFMCYSNGNTYKGEFKNKKKQGKGIYTYKSGSRFEGEFVNDMRDDGITYNYNGVRYEGQYKLDKKHGFGVLYLFDEKKYEGNFINGLAEGKGTFYYSDGRKYEGNFVHNQFQDINAIFYSPNGDKYQGGYQIDKRDGKGIFHCKDGQTFPQEYNMGEKLAIVTTNFYDEIRYFDNALDY